MTPPTSPAVAAVPDPSAVLVDRLYTGFTTLFPPKPIRVEAADINPLPPLMDIAHSDAALRLAPVLTWTATAVAVGAALLVLAIGVTAATERFRAYMVRRRGLALRGTYR